MLLLTFISPHCRHFRIRHLNYVRLTQPFEPVILSVGSSKAFHPYLAGLLFLSFVAVPHSSHRHLDKTYTTQLSSLLVMALTRSW